MQKRKYLNSFSLGSRTVIIFTVLLTYVNLYAQENSILNKNDENEYILKKYVESKGDRIIGFDSLNIKQFWTDNSIISRNNSIEIIFDDHSKSTPFPVQLINVNEALDCKIEIISNNNDYSFSVLNNKSKELTSSQKGDNLIDYYTQTATFHLEDCPNKSFNLVFNSQSRSIVSLKKVILSFSNNQNSVFCVSPGKVTLRSSVIDSSPSISSIKETDTNSFVVTGIKSSLLFNKRFFVSGNTLSASLNILNSGDNETTVYVGYNLYDRYHNKLNRSHYPYKGINKTLTVISAKKDSNTIVLDSFSDWGRNSRLCINALDVITDIPNDNLLRGNILEFTKTEDGKAKLILSAPLQSDINEGTKVRIHNANGSFYTNSMRLKPGEQKKVSSKISLDDSLLLFSNFAFPHGVYYVEPIILSNSTNIQESNTITISDFTISY